MKNIYKWLVPSFLRKWDGVLLERHPVVWRTGAHFVVFYALMGAVVLFGAGFLYPVHKDGEDWVVDPIRPIEFGYDNLYVYTLVLVLVCALLWVYRQFQAGFPFYRLKHTLLTLLIYAGCFWLLVGVTASAVRLGTLVKVAKFWMNANDLTTIRESGIYPYGMMLLPQDTSVNLPIDTFSFFQIREQALKKIWYVEGEILDHRYKLDTSYWFKLFGQNNWYRSYLLYLSYRSDRSYLSNVSYLSYVSNRIINMSTRYESYVSYRSNLLYLSDESYWLFRADRIDQLDRLDRRLSMYLKLTEPKKINQIEKLAKQYGIKNQRDTLIHNPLVIIPSLPNQIEDAVRSINHARQVLQEGIYWRHFFQIGYYLSFLVFLIFFIPFLSLRYLLQVGIVAFLAWFALSFFEIHEHAVFKQLWRIFNSVAHLILPIAGLVGLMWMFYQKKQYSYFKFFTNMVFIGLALTLLGALNYGGNVFLQQFGSPLDPAFYGAQLIGLIAACLTPYVQALPKKQ